MGRVAFGKSHWDRKVTPVFLPRRCPASHSPRSHAHMSHFNADHWERFYAANEHIPTTPTSFAQLVLPWRLCQLEASKSSDVLVELGCGNGRDALWFAQSGVRLVVALDLARASIARLQSAVSVDHRDSASTSATTTTTTKTTTTTTTALADHVRFVEADFTALPDALTASPLSLPSDARVSVVYSRFTLHAIDAPSQQRALAWASRVLVKGGLLAIEARSVLSSLYGQGAAVAGERDAFVCGHYRRFLRRAELCAELRALGFKIELEDERSGVAVYQDDDPVVVRVIARKE